MNRLLVVIVAVAVVSLLGFGVFVVMSGGQRLDLAPAPLTAEAQPGEAEQPAPPPPGATTTAEATARFDAWAKTLRDAGLTLGFKSAIDRGETLSVSGLTVEGPDQAPRWHWTIERASIYDKELFHLQTAGETTITLSTGPDSAISWTGRADAFGIALQKDQRDVLARSIVFRVNGLALQGPGDTAPLTVSDGQLRLLLGGGTGLLPPGTKFTLRLTDVVAPFMAGSALGSKIKSFTTEFALNEKLTSYSFPEVLSLFQTGGTAGVALRTVALDWGTLHFIGDGDVRVERGGALDGRLAVKVSDPLPFLDALSAAGATDAAALADAYAAVLLELGANPADPALPFTIAITAGKIAIEGASRGLADIALGLAPTLVTGASGSPQQATQ